METILVDNGVLEISKQKCNRSNNKLYRNHLLRSEKPQIYVRQAFKQLAADIT